MRSSDWSSDVCSSDLQRRLQGRKRLAIGERFERELAGFLVGVERHQHRSGVVAGPEREEPAADALIAVAHQGEWPLDALAVACLAGVRIAESGFVYGYALLAFSIAAWALLALKPAQPLPFLLLHCPLLPFPLSSLFPPPPHLPPPRPLFHH